MQLSLAPTFADRLRAAERPLVGLWNDSGSTIAAEILAGSGADLVMLDGEHGPIGVDQFVPLLQAVAAYPATAIVRVPWLDSVIIKQVLDAGAQNVVVPMVSTVEQAELAAASVRYPPRGIRGIGSALARASRWARVPDYVAKAHELVSLTVQIETAEGVENAQAIAEVDGVDALFIGPTDLAGSMGFPGAETVAAAVEATIAAAHAGGAFVGVNAFVPADADRYVAAGADFVFVSADVTLLARGAEQAVARLNPQSQVTDTY